MPMTPQEFEQIVQAVSARIGKPVGGGASSARRAIKKLKREIAEIEAEIASLDTSSETVVQAAAVGNVDIATELEAGDTLDGQTLQEDDTVLLPFQTDKTENGVYTVPASGAAARAENWDADDDFLTSRVVSVQNGDYWQGYAFRSDGFPTTLGVTDIVFREIVDSNGIYRFVDDFGVFVVGAFYPWFIGGGGSNFSQSGDADNPGILEAFPTAGGGATICEIAGGEGIDVAGAQRRTRLEIIMGQNGGAWGGGDDGLTQMGLFTATFGNPPSNGIYFSQRSADSPTWLIGAATGGVRTEQDTGIAVAAPMQLFTIDIEPDASQIRYFHNRVEVTGSPIASNIPTGVLIGRRMENAYLSGAGTRTLRVDRYDLRFYADRGI